MKLNDYLDKAEKKAGKKIELAKILGISDAYLRLVRNEKRGLATEVCILLADYIQADRLEVIAASNLVTEKDEKKRKILESCFSVSRAASFTVTALFISVILIVTPSSANASQIMVSSASGVEYFVLCKIVYINSYYSRKFHKILSRSKSLQFPFQNIHILLNIPKPIK